MLTKLGIVAALTATPTPISSQTFDQECNTTASVAEMVMRTRQKGTSLTDVFGVFDEDTPMHRSARAMAKEAFAHPRFSTAENQLEATEEFRTHWHLKCLNHEPLE